MSVKKKNLDVYLEEVHKQFIAIKDDDFSRAQEVFKSVFEQIKQKMGEKCNYFKKYSSEVMYGGSVYDGTKTSKMDEFDMDIVIRLPINYDDIIMECGQPGFVRLKIGSAFDNLDKQQEWEQCHKVTREWRDTDKYLLQNKFRSWMHGIVQKALNEMNDCANVNGTTYLMKYKETGPAYTLYIRNVENDEEFKLDVDLVPVIRFMLPRWPKGYRTTNKVRPSCREWLVVPKPNKAVSGADRSRCWRLSFQKHERDILKDFHHLKKVLRLMKKLRTALKMKAIASYYIKTLFLWKVDKEDKQFWQNSVSFLFGIMLQEFHDALKQNNIPYFWNSKNNLIESLKPAQQKLYTENLKKVLDSIQANDVDKIIFAFLEPDEIEQFKISEIYQRCSMSPAAAACKPSRSSSITSSTSSQEQGNSQNSQMDDRQTVLLKSIVDKLDLLTQKLELQEQRIIKLETAYELSRKGSQKTKLEETAQVPDNMRNVNAAPQFDSDALILF
ncbi:PREDICTED: cyclic GMP-AMP synthase-like [Papilio polytes]|uniref:cyclic GMP-AMP synthase-like n=1 Tax=Papilio polytes TaxID=76194 RepID=UPI00067632CB|nr:PREDICTED: cyclic GMP-AMP synthase-like [Papilio polytes]XP_013134405.1 PREDICTED: cyclic GMP-AMP synthase-like [Papilio polytes]